jgi:hypothetical protein
MKSQNKNKLIPLTLLLLAVLVLTPAAMAASLSTDQEDYAPWEIVTISGSGFIPSWDITVSLEWPDGYLDVLNATTDGYGCFTYDYPKEKYEGTYTVTATDGINTATTTFTDSPGISIQRDTPNAASVSLSTGVSQSFTVHVKDGSTPVSGQVVNWTATGGTLPSPANGTTGTDGKASITYTAPLTAGMFSVTATLASDASKSVSWTVDIVVAPTPPQPHSLYFAASGLPAGVSITVSYTGFNNGGNPISGSTTFLSPGPSGQRTTDPSSEFTYAYPASLTVVSDTYNFVSASPASPLTTGSSGSTTTVTGSYSLYTPPVTNTAPTAEAGGPYSVPEGGSVILSGAGSSDPDGSIVLFEWDFNYDGLAFDVDATGESSKFSAVGLHGPSSRTVALRVTDDDGATNIDTATVNVLDKTAPTASPTQSPAANDAGWNNSDVTVTWNWTDTGGSGIDPANCTISSTSSGEGVITLTATCKDLAGNEGTATYTVKVDKTAPEIIGGTPSGTSGDNGWWKSPVTVPFSAIDNLSGFAPYGALLCEMTPKTTEGQGSALYVTSDGISDMAGNFAPGIQAGAFKVDWEAPVISAWTPSGTPGDNGWWKSPVTVPFSATDNLSGFAPYGALLCEMTPKTTEGQGSALYVTSDGISDMAGNAATAIQAGPFKVDWTPPVVTITLPGTGTYLLKEPVPDAAWSASDPTGGSGFEGDPPSGRLPIDTSSIGTNTLTVPAGAATDVAGNASVETSKDYKVNYGFKGLLPPYEKPPKGFKLGSSIPLKWQYTDYCGTPVQSPGADPLIRIWFASSATIPDPEDIPPIVLNMNDPGASGLRYDSLTMTWQYNWQTKGWSAGQYVIFIQSNETGQNNGPFPIQLREK